MRQVDLHIHTLASDGTYTPEEAVKQAYELGLAGIGISDHDAIESIAPAIEFGKVYGVEIIPAIELSTDIEGKEVHILGYLIDYEGEELKAKLEERKVSRYNRAKKMVAKLGELGFPLDWEKVRGSDPDQALGRPHVARAMIEAGYVKNMGEVFSKYIGVDGPAYVPHQRLTPAEAVKLVLEVGGLPVLAHPGCGSGGEIIEELVEAGLVGIEAFHSRHTPSITDYYLEVAAKYSLLVTGGSDCHGPGEGREILMGKVTVPYSTVEKMYQMKASIFAESLRA